MVARVWRGLTSATKSRRVPAIPNVHRGRGLPRNQWQARGFVLHRASAGGTVEFLFISLWNSLNSISAFAGENVEKAIYYPEDQKFLLRMEPGVAECGRIGYVTFGSGSGSRRESAPSECHITLFATALAETPSVLCPVPAFATFHFTEGQGSGFHFQINFGVDVGRVQ